VVKRSDDVQGFKVLPWRWVVERTFGWLMFQRRLSGPVIKGAIGRSYRKVQSSLVERAFVEEFRRFGQNLVWGNSSSACDFPHLVWGRQNAAAKNFSQVFWTDMPVD
jgi:hypothetical protein